MTASRFTRFPARALACAFAFAVATASFAAGDHGHDHDAAPTAAGPASPRTQAQSDLFELVGVVEDGRMTVYLDRFATNEPITNAKIDYESGARKGVAQPQPDGTYRIQRSRRASPGS